MTLERTAKEGNVEGDFCANLDLLRLLAVAAVVWIHSMETQTLQDWSRWCRFAVPAFTATSVLLLVWRHGGDPAKELWGYVKRRGARIYLLFLLWNCIYAVIRFGEHSVIKGGDTLRWSPATFFLSGFTEQLWFLPFLVVVTVLVAVPAFFWTRMGPKAWLLSMLLTTAGVAMALLPSPIIMDFKVNPASYWFVLSWRAIPAALMVFGILPFCNRIKLKSSRPLLALTMVFVAAILLCRSSYGDDLFLLQNAAGVILVLAAVLGPSPSHFKPMFRMLGGLALPVYLIHVLFVHAVQAVGHRVAHLPVSMSFDAAVFFMGLVGSGLAAWLLKKIPGLKWLVTMG